MLGAKVRIGAPKGYALSPAALTTIEAAAAPGASVRCVIDPVAAVRGADAVYTDVWTSMGQESEADTRDRIFTPYQVNATLMSHAKAGALFMHCLPAHRGYEVTDEVIDSPQSVVFDQSENRLHTQKALLALMAR